MLVLVFAFFSMLMVGVSPCGFQSDRVQVTFVTESLTTFTSTKHF
jgi:hypothetical protein